MKSIEEVNRGIAEFMGDEPRYGVRGHFGGEFYPNYISLDALVPVWEKLRSGFLQITLMDCGHEAEWYKEENEIGYIARKKHYTSIQEAAAIATLKAIEALNEEI